MAHKRLSAFQTEDYGLLCDYLTSFDGLLLTPNILTEAANLVVQIKEPARKALRRTLSRIAHSFPETYIASRTASSQPEYQRLGLTDAGVLSVLTADTLLLTTDFALWIAAGVRGCSATNFNHVRDQTMS